MMIFFMGTGVEFGSLILSHGADKNVEWLGCRCVKKCVNTRTTLTSATLLFIFF